MSLKIITTGLTSRASDIYINEIKEYLNSGHSEKLILMVPDRFSYNAEKLICENFGGIGFNGIDVLTLHQFIRKNNTSANLLSAEGKHMLMSRIMNKCINENSVFYTSKERTGFIQSICEVIDDWKRFCVDTESLLGEINNCSDGITKQKLTTLIDIYNNYEHEFNINNFKDETDLLIDTADYIIKSDEYKNSVIWIDGFVEFAPAEIKIIDAFLSVGADVIIYLPLKDNANIETGDVYSVPQRTFNNLLKLCINKGYKYTVSSANFIKPSKREFLFLCDTYDDTEDVFDGECNSVTLRISDDVYSETEDAAHEILRLVCDEGYDFSDISLLCGDLSKYTSCIEAVFSRYSIPYFADYKVPLSNHPVSILLLSVFELVYKKSFSMHHMFRYLKTGYILSDNDDIDCLCAHVQKRGIKGGMWKEDKYFELKPAGFFDDALGKTNKKSYYGEKLVTLRKKIFEPLFEYYENSKGNKTAAEHTTSFFRYLEQICLYENIQKQIEFLQGMGEDNEASRLAHVWNILVKLFDQMVVALGNEKISRNTFGNYLKAGIEGSEISIIPTLTNGVSVSDAGHRKGSDVKALLILGATRDTVPPVNKDDGIITEAELENFVALPSGVGKSHRNLSKEFELLSAFSETTEHLYISYSKNSVNNEKEQPSSVFELLKTKFKNLELLKTDNYNVISSPESMFHKLLVRLSGDEPLSVYEIAAKEWFEHNDDWQSKLKLLSEAEKYKELTGRISKNIASELYKNITKYSVSRLEMYFSCPFKYFMSVGLNLDEDEEYGMKSSDTGSIVHHALAQFCQLVESGTDDVSEKKQRWSELTDDLKNSYIDSIIADLIDKSAIDIEQDSKMANVFDRLSSTLKRAADLIIVSIKSGNFRIYGNEIPFDNFLISGADGDVSLRGIIDRLDVFEEGDKLHLRVVDYKTGEKSFDLSDVYNGIDLQLVIYAMAAEKLAGENSDVAGFFYNSLKKRMLSCEDLTNVTAELAKLYKLSGTIVEHKQDGVLEVKTGTDMDNDLQTNGESSFLPIKLTNKGFYYANSSVISDVALDTTFNLVRDIICTGVKEIENGDVKVNPYVTSSSDSCMYCPYKTVCVYDFCNGATVNKGDKGKLLKSEIKQNL